MKFQNFFLYAVQHLTVYNNSDHFLCAFYLINSENPLFIKISLHYNVANFKSFYNK